MLSTFIFTFVSGDTFKIILSQSKFLRPGIFLLPSQILSVKNKTTISG